jgi:hypothetical protein
LNAESAIACEPPAPSAELGEEQSAPAPLEETVRSRSSETLGGLGESVDPAATLDLAVQSVADDLSQQANAEEGVLATPTSSNEIESAIGALVSVALAMDDPVAALEEGTESLAEALAARDLERSDKLRAAHQQQLDLQSAYQYARFHRVGELIDLGYGLDQAIAITKANAADIQARAVAAGRDPMEPIYRYALLNGYQGIRLPEQATIARGDGPSATPTGERRGRAPTVMESLAGLDDEAFAEATRGDRWERLLRRS